MPAFRVLAAVLSLMLVAPTLAETLLIDTVEQAPAGLERPHRGMTMDQVRQGFGEPGRVLEAVGDPPITRWVYPRFTVYFEHDRVLRAVIRREAAAAE